MAAKMSGFMTMERIAPARIRSRPCSGSRWSFTPRPARMNENSPIWARLAEHPHRYEEQHREGVPQGKRHLGRLVAQLGFAEDHPGEEGSEGLRLDEAALLDRAQQDYRARDGEREPEDDAPRRRPAQRPGQGEPEERRHGDLGHRARDGDRAHRQQVRQREVESHPEHQQDDAQLGELLRERLVADEAGRERPHGDTREQIAHERRRPTR
jgi:hypothetical protein